MDTTKGTGLCNAFQLKLLALAVMMLDHTNIIFGPNTVPDWLHFISRFVSPLFAFLVVEGFFHTHDRRRYALRLWGVGLFVAAGNLVVGQLTHHLVSLISHTIILTLALGYSVIWAIDEGRRQGGAKGGRLLALAAALGIAGALLAPVEGFIQVLFVMLASYLLHDAKGGRAKLCLCLVLGSAALACLYTPILHPSTASAVDWEMSLGLNADWAQLMAVPFILLYNGERGPKGTLSKWLFYLGYPAHLWAFAVIGMLLGIPSL